MSMADANITFFNSNHMVGQLEVYSKQQQQQNEKKKCRGNRKLQRYRRKLRNQGMDTNTIAELINSSVDMSQLKIDPTTQQNEQIIKSTAPETDFHSTKSSKNKKNINKKPTIIKKQKNKSILTKKVNSSTAINASNDYANIPDEIFSQMLSSTSIGKENLDCFSNEDEKIKFMRHYTSLVDRLSYLHLQDFQWKYYHYIGMTQNIWKGRMTKHFAEKYSICHTYGRSKTMVEQRLKQIEQHLQQAFNSIEEFEKEILSKCIHNDNCFNAMKELFPIIYHFVQEQQKPLQYEFEYKRKILIFDATDHRLVQKFFDLQPNKSHRIIAKHIWQATMKQMKIEEDIALLEHRRLTSTKSQVASSLVHQMIDDIDENLKNLNDTIEIPSTTCCLSNEIKKLEILKSNIIDQAICTSRQMAENLNTIIQIEQKKFSLKNRFTGSTSEWQKLVHDAIEIRRLHMLERTNFNIQHELTVSGNFINNHAITIS